MQYDTLYFFINEVQLHTLHEHVWNIQGYTNILFSLENIN